MKAPIKLSSASDRKERENIKMLNTSEGHNKNESLYGSKGCLSVD